MVVALFFKIHKFHRPIFAFYLKKYNQLLNKNYKLILFSSSSFNNLIVRRANPDANSFKNIVINLKTI